MQDLTADELRAVIESLRHRKDGFLFDDVQSPLPAALRRRAQRGLAYYAVDPAYRLTARLQPVDDAASARLATSTGSWRRLARAGRLTFDFAGEELVLDAFRPLRPERGERATLFVPFRDRTSGGETYGGGRCLDLDCCWRSGEVVLDFNLAYNPTCAYGPGFDCPVPPRANWLPVAIRAGEKMLLPGLH